jgi:predicted choloylglycine hydrolase
MKAREETVTPPMDRLQTQAGPMRLQLHGDHRTMGRQHGVQVKRLRPLIDEAIEARLDEIGKVGYDAQFEALVGRTREALMEHSPATLDFIRGQAQALAYEFEDLLRYDLVSYLLDDLRTRRAAGAEGCTSWAATGSATADGRPILAKNRDYRLEHLPLQVVSHVEPSAGHRYVCVGSAGSPPVYCGGINEAGLAIADTHVVSSAIGPGLPDYALMMHLLEHHRAVSSAVDYLRSVPRLGRNNLILADAHGEVAVFESGHCGYGLFSSTDGALVTTNHPTSPALRRHFMDLNPPVVKGNSFHRYDRVSEALSAAHGQIDVAFARRLMTTHDGPLASLCRHPMEGCDSATIASCVFVPAERTMHLCHGLPCQGTVESFVCSQDGEEL